MGSQGLEIVEWKSNWRILAGWLLLCGILLSLGFPRSTSNLLTDTDTAAIIQGIQKSPHPLHWFQGDWPLGNHFYRPVSTLPFQFDVAVWGTREFGWALTNFLLVWGGIVAFAWFLLELRVQRAIWAGSTLLFTLWNLDYGSCAQMVGGAAFVVAAVWLFKQRRPSPRLLVLPMLLAIFLVFELGGASVLQARMLGWVPGRTASTMTSFALLALAGFARTLRVGGWAARTWWLGGLMLALGAYEQAVMVPALMTGLCLLSALEGTKEKPRWVEWLGPWTVLVAYVLLRRAILPETPSAYQSQSLRSSGFSMVAMESYLFPGVLAWSNLLVATSTSWILLFTQAAMRNVLLIASSVANWVVLLFSKGNWLPKYAYVAAAVAYLPMAWLHTFDHYHFFPMAFKALFVVSAAAGLFAWVNEKSMTD